MRIGKQDYPMLHNGAAMYAIREEYGADYEVFKELEPDTDEAFELACQLAAILTEQGELYRRYQGYEPRPIFTASTIKLLLMPMQIPGMKREVAEAIVAGYKREVIDDEIDLGLAELNKKKETS